MKIRIFVNVFGKILDKLLYIIIKILKFRQRICFYFLDFQKACSRNLFGDLQNLKPVLCKQYRNVEKNLGNLRKYRKNPSKLR